MDIFLENFPLIGEFFERTYGFWRANTAVANITRIAFGFGLALLLASRYKKIGIIFLIFASLMHVVAFVNG